MKKYIFGILAVTLAIGFSAFTTKKSTYLAKSYYYLTGANYQRIEAGVTGTNASASMAVDPFFDDDNASAQVRQLSNWSDDPTDAGTASPYNLIANDGSSYLYKFDIPTYEATSDGTSATDNEVSEEEVIKEIQRVHFNTGTLPATIQVGNVGFKVNVDVIRSENVH